MENKYVAYILNHFRSVYNLPENILEELNKGTSKVSWDQTAKGFFENNDLVPRYETATYLGTEIPVFFASSKTIFEKKKEGVHLNFDFIAASFFLLSGYQDWQMLKKSNRFRARDAFQYRLQVHRIPVVNYYFEMLKEAIETAYSIKIAHHSEQPSLFLSHDIDNMSRGWIECGWAELKSFHIISVVEILFKKLIGKDEWYNLDKIMHLEDRMGVHSTFFLLARKGKDNADYDLTKKKYNKWIALLQGRSFEVGIHGSKGTHRSATLLGADLKRMKKRVFGNRFHYLMFRPQSSYRALEKNKIMYDSSMGFFDEVGFRNGYCFPFRLWNFEEDRPTEFLELPLMAMDTTLQKQKYLYTKKGDAIVLIYDMMREVAKFKGMFSLLWHNNYFSDYKYTGWREVYVESIKSALKLNYKSKTGYLIAEEFVKNRKL